MPTITIDGKSYEYEGKQTLLDFALKSGVEIPYFCYHPAMSSPTNCRMCLVDVGFPAKDRATGEPILEKNGKPQIMWGRKPATSCNQMLAPDMVVKTSHSSKEIKKAQTGVLEFILMNHPLDCPICDQAGECPLQINTFKYGPEGSRFELTKVSKPKRVQLGPRVTLDAERCINCTRCVRFVDEITGSKQLSIIARGEKNFPAAAPGKPFDDPYSINTVDLCPVGALTSTHFRFKARAWEMNYSPSICGGCSKGCNVDVWMRDDKVMRLTPRHNDKVNQYWMCDEGRLDIDKYNDNRLSEARIKGGIPVNIPQATERLATLLEEHSDKVLYIGSSSASLESNYAFMKMADSKGAKTYYAEYKDKNGDDFLRTNKPRANDAGCKLLGMQSKSSDALMKLAESDAYTLVCIAEDDVLAASMVATIKKPIVALAHSVFAKHEKAEVLLPAATLYESRGIYINADNIPQLTTQAKKVRRMTPEMEMAMPKSRLDAGGMAVDSWRHPEHSVDALPAWMLVSAINEHLENYMGYPDHAAIFNQLKSEYAVLADLKINRKNLKQSFKMNQFDFAIG